MDELEAKKYIQSKCADFNTYRVILIIGKAVKVFKSIFKGEYSTITTAEDVRQFMDKYQGFYNDKPIVFEDISLMTKEVQSRLLKFIEEPTSPLIILASKDNVSPIILSRCKLIIKIPEETNTTFMSLSEFIDYKTKTLDALKQDGRQAEFDLEYEASHRCPEYLGYISMLQSNSHKSYAVIDRYIKLLDIS